ncbi:hypothetical protein C9927_04615 [Pseudidiomarina aestuarii]|uniref:Uncharacterized protein n=1 Tax=Pseudidiomarina aestuarii TaxID=624146 RepID=A0A2T4D327_9GAMM|nr:hypothetical protein C9928_06875 [Pseudidiomarina aestuarii]PTB88221.1 hypothetical protein C9927_04615 [Pseudidiomarina aestuarii]
MPSKHIKDDVWSQIEKLTVKTIISTKTNIKDTEVLDLLIKKGLEAVDEIDLDQLALKKLKKK